MASLTLAELLKDNGLPVVVGEQLAKAPSGLKTVKEFANFFESKGEVNSLFCRHIELLKNDGTAIANLKQAWREADALVERHLKRSATGLPEEALEDPLRSEVQGSLKATFFSTYKFEIPRVWQGVDSLLGCFHKVF